MTRLFWRILPDVRPDERRRFLFFAGLLTLISLAQTMGLAGTEALFLAQLGIERLSHAFVAAAALTVVGSIAYAVRVGSARNDGLFLRMLILPGLGICAGAWAVAAGFAPVVPVLFCFWYLAQAVYLNHFWTFAGDYFDTLSSKRLIPLFTIGSSVGGVLGGVFAALLTQATGPVGLIAGWGVALIAAGLLLVVGLRALRSWGPLELEEADETSLEGLLGALRFLGRSPLSRWLTVSALGMVLAAFVAQYLYSDIFLRRFPDPADLAAFFALYFAVTNVVEIVLEVVVTPLLIRRVGVPGANLLHPVLLLFSFAGLSWRYGLVAGVAARVSRELVDNAVAAPVRSLVQNAIPPRFRGRVRAFLEGIVVYAGMAVAGLVLLLLDAPEPRVLCALGAAASLFYLFANWRALRAYLDTLLEQLVSGHLDFADVEGAIGSWEVERLAELWEETLQHEGQRPSASLLRLVPVMAQRGLVDPLVRAASHPNSDVRRASIEGLASTGAESAVGPLALALDDPAPSVRLAAVRGLGAVAQQSNFLETRLDDLLDDPDPDVRAHAAALAGVAGGATLAKMIGSPRAAEAVAALALAGDELRDAALERVGAEDPEIRRAALLCVARSGRESPLDLDALVELLRHPDAGVRAAAIELAQLLPGFEACELIAAAFGDPALEVRRAAEAALVTRGADGATAAEACLRAPLERTAAAAYRVMSRVDGHDARPLLVSELRYRAEQSWWHLLGARLLPRGSDPVERFLRRAFRDAVVRERRLAFVLLELLETPAVLRKVERELRGGSPRSRANALEVLSNVGDRHAAGLLSLLHEPAPLEDRVPRVRHLVTTPAHPGELVEAARQSDNPWVRMAARALRPREGDAPAEEERMQRLLALKQVDLFANLGFEQLDAIHQATNEVQFLSGEVLFREGQRGDTLYLLLEGSVDIVLRHGGADAVLLNRLDAVTFLGEMAILTDEPRSATAVAATDCRLLTLEGGAFRELIFQFPEISFEIFRVLQGRVRRAESR